jgi:folate-dependent phosphoribosylglycinamide formyltransferase PurN
MRLAILSSFPLVDNHHYKKFFLRGVESRSDKLSEVVLVYSHIGLADHLREAWNRFGFADSLRRFRHNRAAPSDAENGNGSSGDQGTKLPTLAAHAGIEVRRFDRFGTPECVRFLENFRPDVIHNFSGMYIPQAVLAASRVGVVSGHYGLLPQVRGADTVRWSILLDIQQAVSHMFLSAEMDMGDILSTEAVSVARGDDLARIRRKCQTLNGAAHLRLLDRISTGDVTWTPQRREQGTYFYPMGKRLREKVDRILREQRYACYAD